MIPPAKVVVDAGVAANLITADVRLVQALQGTELEGVVRSIFDP